MERLIDINSSPVANYLDILLKDMTTGKNIIWATDAYLKYGEDFGDKNQNISDMGSETEQSAMTNRVEPRETGSSRFFYAEFCSDFQNLDERLFSGEKERWD